jgi:hypothetical protein
MNERRSSLCKGCQQFNQFALLFADERLHTTFATRQPEHMDVAHSSNSAAYTDAWCYMALTWEDVRMPISGCPDSGRRPVT